MRMLMSTCTALLSAMSDVAAKGMQPGNKGGTSPRSLIHCIFGGTHQSQVRRRRVAAQQQTLATHSAE